MNYAKGDCVFVLNCAQRPVINLEGSQGLDATRRHGHVKVHVYHARRQVPPF